MIGDTIASALAELQAEAESLMVTPCRVVRPGGVTADPATGADVPASAPVFAGRCKLQAGQAQAQAVESGQGSVTLQRQEAHLPARSGPYRRDDVVEVLDREDGPAAVVLRRLRVVNVPAKTWQTAQRLPVEEVA